MDHIRAELDRVSALMKKAGPSEHGMLYAARTALQFAIDPQNARSPSSVVSSIHQGQQDCCPTYRPGSSERTAAPETMS